MLSGFATYKWFSDNDETVLSPKAQALLGVSGPIKTDDFFAMVHSDDRVRYEAETIAFLENGGEFTREFRWIRPDGATVHILHHATLTRPASENHDQITGIFIDMTSSGITLAAGLGVGDRGEAHAPLNPDTGMVNRVTGNLTNITQDVAQIKAYQGVQDTFWKLVDPAPFGVYAVNADFKIVRMSKGGQAAFDGIDPLLGRDLEEVLHILWPASFASEAVAQFRNTLKTGEPYRPAPVIEERSDRGVLEAYDWGIDRMVLDDGRYGVICHFYDLTERVRFQNELQEREQRLELAYHAAEMGAWEVDLKTGETIWTRQLYDMFGVPGEHAKPEDLWKRGVHPDDFGQVNDAFESAVNGGPPFDVDFRAVLPSGETRFFTTKGEVISGEDGTAQRIIGVNFDITLRKMAEEALRGSERRMRLILDSAIAFIGVLDPDGTLREANQTALSAGGVTRSDVLGKPFWETYWWTHDPAVAARLKDDCAKAREGDIIRQDVVVRMANENLITIEFMLVPVFDDAGKLQMLVASGFDISEREEARARAVSLMGEINHRTKNILTLVQAVARQTARGGADDFVDRFEMRLNALADAQDLLVKNATDTIELRELAESQLGHFRDLFENRIHFSGPSTMLAPHASQAIGMALHELATNAGKYGALSSEDGSVDVTWSVQPGDDGEVLDLRWAEENGPPVVPPESRGFGSTVIDQMARATLNGEVQLDYAPDGVKWHFVCPMSKLTNP